MKCPKCESKHIGTREYFKNGHLTEQLFECQKCFLTGDSAHFNDNRYPDHIFNLAKDKMRFLKSRCRKKGLEFNLEMEDLLYFYSLQYCELTGVELIDATSGIDPIRFNNRSFDRIDNKKGYIKGNIMVVCHSANKLKAKYEDPGNKEHVSDTENLSELVKSIILEQWRQSPLVGWKFGTNAPREVA